MLAETGRKTRHAIGFALLYGPLPMLVLLVILDRFFAAFGEGIGHLCLACSAVQAAADAIRPTYGSWLAGTYSVIRIASQWYFLLSLMVALVVRAILAPPPRERSIWPMLRGLYLVLAVLLMGCSYVLFLDWGQVRPLGGIVQALIVGLTPGCLAGAICLFDERLFGARVHL